MAIVYEDANLDSPFAYPVMNRLWKDYPITFSSRVYYDDSWPDFTEKPIVGYLHGSGATGFPQGNLLNALVGAGYVVIAVMHLGYPSGTIPDMGSSEPFRYGYGNVNSPHFMAHFIKDAFWCDMVSYVCSNISSAHNKPFLILGHSMGASAAISWAAGNSGFKNISPNFKGIIANAGTVGGLGDGSFNAMPRNVNTMTDMVHRIKCKALLTYADDDLYAPPEYARRIQSVIPDGKDTFSLSAGLGGHNWLQSPSGSTQMTSWVTQLMTDQPILDRLGNGAISGASS